MEHLSKNVSLICLSICCLPVTTTLVALCCLYGYLFPMALPIPSSSCDPKTRKTVLVSSLAMTKGLFLARAFYLDGHRVIGLDFRREGVPSSGKYSRALSEYYELPTPNGNFEEYVQKLIEIIKKEGIDLWICVSGVETTERDAAAKDRIQKETACKVFQLEPAICQTLDNKWQFIQKTKAIGLRAPETCRMASKEEASNFLEGKTAPERYILKAIWLDDVSRADMTRHPQQGTEAVISNLDISDEKAWVFQEFVKGEEYCTHAVVVRGCVKAFVCCPSSAMLMHYRALSRYSEIWPKIYEFTKKYVDGLAEKGKELTGQLSFDFIVGESDGELYPIECNPRTHTAVVLFERDMKRLADCYLSLLATEDSQLAADPQLAAAVYTPDTTFAGGYYWIGHDIVSLLLLPFLHIISDFSGFFSALWEFIEHLLCWKDATFEFWDPVPFWLLYHVYWPCMFALSIIKWRKWSKINVSTTRIFECK